MKSIIKNKIVFLYLSIILFLLFAIFLDVILNNNSVLLFYGDTVEQHYQFAMGISERIRNLDFNFWDWSLGFGTNSFAMSFYNLFSPFSLILGLIPKDFIRYSYLYLIILKFLTFSLFSFLWLSKITKNRSILLIAILISTFSGYNFFYIGQHFLDVVVIFPLALYFMEIYLQEDKILGLSLVFASMTLINYYFTYMFVPFSLLYFAFRSIYLFKSIKPVRIITSLAKFTGFVILGILIGSIVLFPVSYITLSVPRLSEIDLNIFTRLTKYDLFRNITNIFSPAINFQDASFYLHTPSKTKYLAGAGASIYTSILTVILLPLIIRIKEVKKRWLFLATFLILLIMMLFPFFSLVLNGDYNTRWYFMFTFFLIIYDVHILEELVNGTIESKYITFSGIFITFLILISTLISYNYQLNSLDRLQQLIQVNTILCVLILLFAFLIYFKKSTYYIILIICLEIFINGRLLLANYGLINHELVPEVNTIHSSIDTILDNDNGFYRIKNDGFQLYSYNVPYAFNYPGLSFYSSLYTASQQDYLDRLIVSWTVTNFDGKYQLYNLLSTKYFQKSERSATIPFGYILDEEIPDTYLNKYFIELGFMSSKTINSEFVKTLPYLLQDRIMQEYIVSESSDNTEFELNDNIEQVIEFADANYVEYSSPDSLNGKIIYIENFGVPEVFVELYEGEYLVNSYYYYQFNYIDLFIQEERQVDKVVIKANDTFGYGSTLNLYVQNNPYEFNEWMFEKRLNNSFDDIEFTNDNFSTSINVNEDGILYTSIPFDLGWTAYVDGVEVKPEKVNLGFIGLNLSKGYHTIEFRYMSPFVIEGSVVSFISILALYFINRHRDYRRALEMRKDILKK